MARFKNSRNQGFRPYLIASLFGFMVMGLLVGLFAIIMSTIQLFDGVENLLSLLAIAFGCIISGVLIGKVQRTNGLSSGAKCGILIFLAVVIISIISGNFTGQFFITKILICICGGAIGGVVGVNSKVRV